MAVDASGQAGHLRRAGRAASHLRRHGAGVTLLELKLEGKKRIGGEAFANGQRLQENESLGG